MRKPVFGVSDQVRHKSGCTYTEDGWRLEILFSHVQNKRFSHDVAHLVDEEETLGLPFDILDFRV